MRRSSTRPACLSCARWVEIWLWPLARISCSSATESSSCSNKQQQAKAVGIGRQTQRFED